jgi:hypothetical protein
MLDTQETTEAKYKKWEKEPVPHGWDDELISLDMFDLDMVLFDQFDIFFRCVKNDNIIFDDTSIFT